MAASAGQIVALQRGGHKLHVMTNNGAVLAYRANKIPFSQVLQTNTIFTNITRGDVAGADLLHIVFDTEDLDECCKIIIDNGELQLTTAQRREMVDEKRREIITFINKNWVNPQTQLPHPVTRIEGAVSKVRFIPDPNREARPQAEDLVKKLRGQLSFVKAVYVTAYLTLKHQYVGQLDNAVRQIANVVHTNWDGEGCTYTLELSRADQERLEGALSGATHGDYGFRVATEEDGGAPPPPPEEQRSGKKKKKKNKKNRNRGQPAAAAAATVPADDAPAEMAAPSPERRRNKKKKKRRDAAPADAAPPAQEAAEVPSRRRNKKSRRQNRE